jgi:hypothetical protein
VNNSHNHGNNHHGHNNHNGRDDSFGATSATVTSSPVGGMTFSFPPPPGRQQGEGDEREGLGKPIHMNGASVGSTGTNGLLSSRHHLHSSYHHHTNNNQQPSHYHPPSTMTNGSHTYGISSSSSTPTFPGLTEDYEPSSSGRSSNDTPVLLHAGTFPPSIVGASGEALSGRYTMDDVTLTPKGSSGYGYGAGGQGPGQHGRTILLGDGSIPGELSGPAHKERDSGPFKIFGIDIKWIS